jgi:hypothetical protein
MAFWMRASCSGESKQADIAFWAATTDRLDGGPATLLEQFQGQGLTHSLVAQSRFLHQLPDFDALFVQSSDWLAPLEKLLRYLLSRVFFFHAKVECDIISKLNLNGVGQPARVRLVL